MLQHTMVMCSASLDLETEEAIMQSQAQPTKYNGFSRNLSEWCPEGTLTSGSVGDLQRNTKED